MTLQANLCQQEDDNFTFAIPKQTWIILKSDFDDFMKELIQDLIDINLDRENRQTRLNEYIEILMGKYYSYEVGEGQPSKEKQK